MRTLEVVVLDEEALPNLPSYATEGAAGLDIKAFLPSPVTIAPGQTLMIPTGLAVYIKDPNYVGLLMSRSGLGHKHGIVLGNTIGVIDSDYQGQLFISCFNRSQIPYTIKSGDRIAQLLIIPVQQVSLKVVASFTPQEDGKAATHRGAGGFGSTGI